MSSGAVQRDHSSHGPPQGASPPSYGGPANHAVGSHQFTEVHCNQKELHLAALASLKGEILELSSRLQMVSQERDMLEKTLTKTQLEKVRVERESEDKLDTQAQRYEERLTELHSVIAELSRKIEQQRINVITEEEEEGPEEYSHSEVSHDQQDVTEESASELVELEGLDDQQDRQTATDPSTSCDIDERAVEAGEGIADLDVSECRRASGSRGANSSTGHSQQQSQHSEEDHSLSATAPGGEGRRGDRRGMMSAEEEVRMLKAENNSLQHALALAQHNVAAHRSTIAAITQDRDALRKKLRETQRLTPALPPQAPHVADAVTIRGLRGCLSTPPPPGHHTTASQVGSSGQYGSSGVAGSSDRGQGGSPAPSPLPPDHSPSHEEPPVICKLAERVRLKKVESGDHRVTGSDLSAVGVWSTAVAEQLVAGVQEESDSQELYNALVTAGGALVPHERLKEFEVEIERLHARIDHLKAQNDVLAITLSESKAHCDHLSVLIGKYESNCTALQLAVTNSEKTLEAYEVLVALLESEIGLLLASCKAAGIGVKGSCWSGMDQEDLVGLIKRAQDQRRSTENVARHLLSRLDRHGAGHPDDDAWDDAGMSHNTSTTSSTSSGVDSDQSRTEEHRLRDHIAKLRDERSQVSSSMMSLQPLHIDPLTQHYPLTLQDAQKLDLENAVLMQELTAMREDRAELRAQVYLLEREKAGLELRVGTCEAQAAAYCATIDHLRAELQQRDPEGFKDAEGEGDSGVDSSSPEIMEALRREKHLKGRVQDLISTLEKVTKNSEARHLQSQEFINDLKKANGALLTAVDRLKKKYGLKMKRMEQQMLGMVDRHSHQVRVLKQRIAVLEEDLLCRGGAVGGSQLPSSSSTSTCASNLPPPQQQQQQQTSSATTATSGAGSNPASAVTSSVTASETSL